MRWFNFEGKGDGHLDPERVSSGVPLLGGGNDARMSEIEPERRRGSFSMLAMSSIPVLLAVFPLSRLAANLVALRMRSGKLVMLPLVSESLTASMSN